MQVRRLSPFTQRSYVETVARFARYFDRSPERLGPERIRAYQVYLATERGLATSSLLVAVSALRFLCRVTRQKRWSFDDVIPARAAQRVREKTLACLLAKHRIRRIDAAAAPPVASGGGQGSAGCRRGCSCPCAAATVKVSPQSAAGKCWLPTSVEFRCPWPDPPEPRRMRYAPSRTPRHPAAALSRLRRSHM